MNTEFTVKKDTTVKAFLREELQLSAKLITHLKKLSDGILLNGKHVTVRAAMHAGDCLSLKLDDEIGSENERVLPIKLHFDILYEDSDILAVSKPSGMPTHTSHGHMNDTLANAVAYYYKEKGRPFVFRAANRLDSDTSGVLLIALHRRAAASLSRALKNGEVEKTYLALLSAIPEKKSGHISTGIRRKSGSVLLREAVCENAEGADAAETDYTVVGTGEGVALVRVTPLTGRTHQIRVHMQSIGCALLGDHLYGDEKSFPRQALHALSLSFPHPITKRRITVSAPLPQDMTTYIESNINVNKDLLYQG